MPMAGCHKPRGKYIVTGEKEMPSKKNSVRTTKSVASTASKVLRTSTSKAAKTVAGSALSNRKAKSK